MNYEALINGAKILAIFACITLALFMLFSYANIKGKLAQKEYENASLSLALENQRKALQKITLDLESYKKSKPKIEEKIIYKYKESKTPKPSSCDERLEFIQSQIKLWYGVE